jgi:hypothetical protein
LHGSFIAQKAWIRRRILTALVLSEMTKATHGTLQEGTENSRTLK